MIQILGDGFGTDAGVVRAWIGGVAAQIVSIQGRMLTIRVPPGAQTGPVRIWRAGPGGGTTVQSPAPFTIQP